MNATSTTYCETCGTKILGAWQGWPHKDVVPILPKLESELCPSCGGGAALTSNRIAWFNYHGRFSTGLPEYWLLQIGGDTTHWGLPYFAEGQCPKCHSRTIVSEMKYPNGTHELMHNCPLTATIGPGMVDRWVPGGPGRCLHFLSAERILRGARTSKGLARLMDLNLKTVKGARARLLDQLRSFPRALCHPPERLSSWWALAP
jgi:hypothetical protein